MAKTLSKQVFSYLALGLAKYIEREQKYPYYCPSQIPHQLCYTHGTMKNLILTPKQAKLITNLVHASTIPQCIVLRAGLILDYAEAGNKFSVSTKYSVGRDTVRRWCQRWQSYQAELGRLETENQTGTLSDTMYRREIEIILADAERPGTPGIFTEEQKRQIIAVAARKPEDEGVPVTHWSHELLAQTVVDKGIVKSISAAQIGRFLKERSITTTPKSVLGTSQH